MVTRDELMPGYSRTPSGIYTEIIVIEAVPDCGSADLLVIVGQLPVVF